MKYYIDVNPIFINIKNKMSDLKKGAEIYFKYIKIYLYMALKIKIELIKKQEYFHILIYYYFQFDKFKMLKLEKFIHCQLCTEKLFKELSTIRYRNNKK